MGLVDRFQSAWNAFMNKDPTEYRYTDIGIGSSYRPDRPRFTRGNEKTIVTSVYNRIAIDVAAITFEHVRLDDNDRFISVIDSGLNRCLTIEANKDQTGRAFMQDVVMSMLDEGVVAIVPIDTTTDPWATTSFDIRSMRTAKILDWYPDNVRIKVYNDRDGQMHEKLVPKATTCIIENPLYAIMNEPNSTLQRLIRKLSLLDIIDEQSGSGKLDLIIQLPYLIKSPARKQQAEERRKDIEMQLSSSKYGIAYTESTEKVTQLNRPLENKLLAQIEYLTSMLYSQLGITTSIMDGTADEQTMLNYQNRTIEPFATAIVDEMKRKFLSKTAMTQKQSIYYFRDPFRLVPITQLAELADVFSRNEILSSNEWRQIVGMKPVDTNRANELVNKNMPAEDTGFPIDAVQAEEAAAPMTEEEYLQNVGQLDDLDEDLDKLEKSLNHSDNTDTLVHAQYASKYYDPVKAHEYYMKNRELKNRRSTKSLNEEGRYTAQYVKERLNAERDQKINQHLQKTNSSISSNNTKTASGIASSKKTLDSNVESNRSRMNSQIKSNTDRTNAQIKSNTEQLNNELKSERENMKSVISSHAAATKSKIKQLQDMLSNMGPKQRRARREEFASQIEELREENAQKREQLQSAFSEYSNKSREDNRNKSSELRETNSAKNASEREKTGEENKKLREEHSESSKKLREENSKNNAKLKEEHTKTKKELNDEYEEKYLKELDKIKQDERYKAPEKVKKAKAKAKTTKKKRTVYKPFWWK